MKVLIVLTTGHLVYSGTLPAIPRVGDRVSFDARRGPEYDGPQDRPVEAIGTVTDVIWTIHEGDKFVAQITLLEHRA